MQSYVHPLGVILGEKTQWIVPVYQRNYSWSSDEEDSRISDFWEDLCEQVTTALDGQKCVPHYFGAIISTDSNDVNSKKFGEIPKRDIVDGQQRLTTFQLFLAAIREAANELAYKDKNDAINSLLFNQNHQTTSNPERFKFKLWPSGADRDIIRDILEKSSSELQKKYHNFFGKKNLIKDDNVPKALRAYWFFHEKIIDFIKEKKSTNSHSTEIIINMFLDTFVGALQIVNIQLENGDDAHEIFASLNGKSQPLSSFDLIRNNIFHRATKNNEEINKLFERQWKTFEEPFWKVETKHGRLKKARADYMVGHAVIAQMGREISFSKIATEYEKLVRTSIFNSAEEELNILGRFGEIYKTIEEQPVGAITNRISSMLKIWDLTIFHPIILWVEFQNLNDYDKNSIYTFLESYLVRRQICGYISTNLNKVAVSIIREFKKNNDITNTINTFSTFMKGSEGNSTKFPSNDEIARVCRSNDMYKISSKKKIYIFRKIEEHMRSKHDEMTVLPEKLTIEHILPVRWAQHWPLMDGTIIPSDSLADGDDGDNLNFKDDVKCLVADRQSLVNTIGNLTLLTESCNSSISNNGWPSKKAKLGESLLALNRKISQEETWDETSIRKRTELLTEYIIKIWPAI